MNSIRLVSYISLVSDHCDHIIPYQPQASSSHCLLVKRRTANISLAPGYIGRTSEPLILQLWDYKQLRNMINKLQHHWGRG